MYRINVLMYRSANAFYFLQPHEVLPEYLKGRAAKNTAPAEKTNKSTKETKKKPPALTFHEGAKVQSFIIII